MSYRQLLKATHFYVKNLKFKTFITKIYKKNINQNITQQQIKAFIQVLRLISQERATAIKQKKFKLTSNLNYNFIKGDHFILDDSKQQIQKIFEKSSNDQQSFKYPQLNRAYKFFMIMQFFYGINAQTVYIKQKGKNYQLLKQWRRQKKVIIDQNLTLNLI